MSLVRRFYGYFALLIVGWLIIAVIPVQHNPELFLWYAALISIAYVPYIFISESKPRADVHETEDWKPKVMNDMAHFREVVERAVKGNPIAQREVEMRILNMVSMELALRYEVPAKKLRDSFGDVKFLRRYMGDVAKDVVSLYNRKHDLKRVVPEKQFLGEIERIMEAMK